MAELAKSRDILARAKETLETARFGMQLVNSENPNERIVGLRNVVVFGRAVTNVIQNLRSVVVNFDDWYEPWLTRMQNDSVAAYLYKVRSEILKQGKLKTGLVMRGGFDLGSLQPAMQNPPPGALGFFVGDSLGGSGWEVQMPNGDIEKYYVSLQALTGLNLRMDLYLADAPDGIRTTPIPNLCAHYLEMLTSIVQSAMQRFGN